jgi:hypothetical protein
MSEKGMWRSSRRTGEMGRQVPVRILHTTLVLRRDWPPACSAAGRKSLPQDDQLHESATKLSKQTFNLFQFIAITGNRIHLGLPYFRNATRVD